MEIWRVGSDTAARPKVLNGHNLSVALVLHVAFFAVFWIYSVFHGLFDKKEEIVPIDLTVVVVENLNGKEDEPPPLKKPESPPPPKPKPPKPKPPKPKPKPKEPEKPKELEKIVTNIVRKVEKKETKKPEKTKAELRKEQMERIRKSTKQVNTTTVVQQQPNGRTDKRPLNWKELLNKGYKPGKTTNLAANEEQLGYSLIKQSFEAKWNKPPWTDTMKPMVIRVWFGNGGKIVNYRLVSSSGDARADQSIKSAAARVIAIPALPAGFIDKYRTSGVPVRFTVTPQ